MKKKLLFLMCFVGYFSLQMTAQNLPVQFIYPFSDSVPAPLAKEIVGVHWTGSQIWLIGASSSRRTISRYTPTLRYIDSIQIKGDFGSATPVYDIETINGGMWIAFNKDSIAKISETGQIIKKVKVKNQTPRLNTSIRTLAAIGNTGLMYAGGIGTASTGNNIWKIDTLGNVYETIIIADHRSEAVYGMVYDDKTAGGPYLWVNCQFSGSGQAGLNGTFVRQLKIANNSSYSTCYEKNVFFDTPWALGGTFFAAGGMSIGNLPGSTTPSLFVISQYSTSGGLQKGALAIYNLANFQPLTAPDLGIDSFTMNTVGGLTRFPAALNTTVTYKSKIMNRSPTAATGTMNLTLTRDSVRIINTSVPLSNNAFTYNYVNTPTISANQKGRYEVGIKVSAANDCNAVNDSSTFRFTVTDSTYGRDIYDHPAALSGAISIGGALLPRRIGMVYTFPHDVTISSLSILHRVITLNDSMYATVWRFKNGYPTDSLAASQLYNPKTAADTAGQGNIGLMRTHTLTTPLFVKKGDTIVVGMTEMKTANIYQWTDMPDVSQSNFMFYYRTSVVSSRPAGWYSDTVPSVFATNKRSMVIRVNAQMRVGTKDLASGSIKNLVIAPNPTTGDVMLNLSLDKSEKGRIVVSDLSGRQMFSQNFEAQTLNEPLSFADLPNGLYILRVQTESGGQVIRKVVKQ